MNKLNLKKMAAVFTVLLTSLSSIGFAAYERSEIASSYALGAKNIDRAIALATDKDGNLFIADTNDGNPTVSYVYKIDPQGNRKEIASSYSFGAKQIGRVIALATDMNGNLYMADTRDGNPTVSYVFKMDPQGNRTEIASSYSFGAKQIGRVVALATDINGNLYMADTRDGNPTVSYVYKIDPQGNRKEIASSYSFGAKQIGRVIALTTDINGNLYMADTRDGNPTVSYVYKIDPQGNRTEIGSTYALGTKNINRAVALTTDMDGNLYLADTQDGNPIVSYVYKYDTEGKRTEIASTYGLGTKSIERAVALSADRDGNLFVADTQDGNPIVSYVYKYREKQYPLTVLNGNNSGSYRENSLVPISAAPMLEPSDSKQTLFDHWATTTSNISIIFDPKSPSTFLTMPAKYTIVEAVYKKLYKLNVTDGLGSGFYTGGTVVSIQANEPPVNYRFDGWSASEGVLIADANAATTQITMPENPANVTAKFRYIPPTVPITLDMSYKAMELNGGYRGWYVSNPTATATDRMGYLYVADLKRSEMGSHAHRILQISPNGSAKELNGGFRGWYVENPRALATDKTGNLYIADLKQSEMGSHAHRILKVSPDGTAKELNGGFRGWYVENPTALATDEDGNLYIADLKQSAMGSHAHRILKVSPDGTAKELNGGYRGWYVQNPRALATDKAGNLYIADLKQSEMGSHAHRILKVSPDGTAKELNGGYRGWYVENPTGLATDKEGNLYITDQKQSMMGAHANRLLKIAADGSAAYELNGGYRDWYLDSPAGVATNANGNIFVIDLKQSMLGSSSTADKIASLATKGCFTFTKSSAR
jgi:sugar lactone lactonase YvrE